MGPSIADVRAVELVRKKGSDADGRRPASREKPNAPSLFAGNAGRPRLHDLRPCAPRIATAHRGRCGERACCGGRTRRWRRWRFLEGLSSPWSAD